MSETESTRDQGNCGPACEGDKLIVEVLGNDHPDGQELHILNHEESAIYTAIDDQRVNEILDSSILRVWPWENTPQADVALEIRASEGDPLQIPLYSLPASTPRQLIRQKLILAPLVPLTLVEREEPIVGVPAQQIVSARSGYLYLFRDNRLWREIQISQDDEGRPLFRDVPLSHYREAGQQYLTANMRPPTSVPLEEIWVPVSYYSTSATYASDVRVAWSEVQWSAARIDYLENDGSAYNERTQRIVERPDARWHPRFAELVPLDEVVPQRCRQPLLEEQLPCTLDFLTDLGGGYGLDCYDLAVEEQKSFFAGGEDAEDAWRESQYQNTELGSTAAIRNMVLQDLVRETGDDGSSEGSSSTVWENIGESVDIFGGCRARDVFGIVVYDELYEIRKAMARTNAGIQYQQAVRAWAQKQPHFQSAELIEQTVLPARLGGQENPLREHSEHIDLSLTGKFERSLHRAYRALAINATKAAQKRLLSLVDDAHNQSRMADLFSLEGGDYLSGFLLCGSMFSALQHDPEIVDKPWLAGANPDCSTDCRGTLTRPEDNHAIDGSQLVLDIAREGASHPLHHMLYPGPDTVPLNKPYAPPEAESNPGDGLFRPAAFAELDGNNFLPEQENLQTLEVASVMALTQQGAYDFFGATRDIVKALDSVSGLLMEQLTKAQKRLMNDTLRIEMDIHGPMVRALKAMNPTVLGELHLLPYADRTMNMVLLGVEDPEIGLRNGLTEAERDYYNKNNQSGRFLGEIQDSQGRIIASTNPNRVPGGSDLQESGRFIAFMAPASSELVHNHREVRRQISRQRSLGQSFEKLGLPYVVLGVELWNVLNTQSNYQRQLRERGVGRADSGFYSAAGDLALASVSVAEHISKRMLGSTAIARQMNRVILDVEAAVSAGRISKGFGSRLPSAVTLRMTSISLLAIIDSGIRAVDTVHYISTGQIASATAMGTSTVGSLMTAWASFSLMSGGSATGAGSVLGLSALSGGVILGIGLVLAIGGGVIAALLEDDELEAWLKNGPFGEYRSNSYEHLWGQSAGEEHVPEREAFYRLASILAGVRIDESLYHVGTIEAYRIADSILREQHGEPSRREVDRLRQDLEKVNFRIVVKSNLLTVMDDAAVKVHFRRLLEERRPNPPGGGTNVYRNELQEPPESHWWIYRRRLPDGFEYWLHTPRPQGLVIHEWKVRARLIANLDTEQEYIFPAPPVSDPLIFDSTEHNEHDNPDFARDAAPFWASLTTDRRSLSARAIGDIRKKPEKGVNVG